MPNVSPARQGWVRRRGSRFIRTRIWDRRTHPISSKRQEFFLEGHFVWCSRWVRMSAPTLSSCETLTLKAPYPFCH